MKFVLSFLVICSSFWSIQLQANYLTDIEQIIQDIKTNDISLEQILMLMDLDEADSSIGYALCVESGEQYYNCHSGANLAYGLCVVSGEQYYNCNPDAKLGYGICVASGEQYYNCSKTGTIGYGLCVASGEQYYNCAD